MSESRATDFDLAAEVLEVLRCQRQKFTKVFLPHREVKAFNDEFRVFHLGSLSLGYWLP